jgi:hypothetical protein
LGIKKGVSIMMNNDIKPYPKFWHGKGFYDSETYYFIKECKTMPKEVDVGTCWIGDKYTYEEIINNL